MLAVRILVVNTSGRRMQQSGGASFACGKRSRPWPVKEATGKGSSICGTACSSPLQSRARDVRAPAACERSIFRPSHLPSVLAAGPSLGTSSAERQRTICLSHVKNSSGRQLSDAGGLVTALRCLALSMSWGSNIRSTKGNSTTVPVSIHYYFLRGTELLKADPLPIGRQGLSAALFVWSPSTLRNGRQLRGS